MGTINGNSFQDIRNINLRGGASGSGLIRWNPAQNTVVNGGNWSSNPFSTDDYGLYINAAGNLVFSSLGSTTVLGAAGGGGGVPTWSQIFAGQATFQLAGTTWTIDNNTGNNNILTLTNSGAGSGNLIQITNSGTGKDINGTSNAWSVDKSGNAVFLQVTSATYTGSGAVTLSANGSSAITIGSGSNTVTVGVAATFSSSLTVTAGATVLGSTSNVAASLQVTNNTITTFGAAGVANAGMVIFRSTSITTGDLVRIQAAEGTITGNYLDIYDTVASASVFKVGPTGAVTIAGTPAGGTNVLTITEGDAVLSDGSIFITDADNAASFTVTNNTATSASAIALAGSGVFTGSTTTSFMTITASGLTTGTAVYVPVAALTTGRAIHVVANALTSGIVFNVTSSATAITTTGRLFLSTHTGATGTSAILNEFISAANDETIILQVTASSTLALGVGLGVSVGSMTTGTGILVTPTGITTGIALDVHGVDALTTGLGISVTSAATAITTGALLKVSHTGATGTSATLVQFLTSANDETILLGLTGNTLTTGSLVVASATALTSGVLASFTGGGANMTSSGIVFDIEMGAATAGTGLKVLTSGVFAGSNNVVLVSANSATTTTGVLSVTATGLTSGTAVLGTGGTSMTSVGVLFFANLGAATAGSGFDAVTTGVYTDTTGLHSLTANSATTGTLSVISGTGMTSGTGLIITGGGSNMLTAGIDLSVAMGAATVGSGIKIVTTGVYTDTSAAVMNIIASSATLGNILAVTASSTKSLIVGLTLANPALQVDTSTGSSVTGLLLKSNATGLGFAVSLQSSGTNEALTIDAKGSGNMVLNGTATGFVVMNRGAQKTFVMGNTSTAIATQNGTPTAAQLLGGIIVHTSATGAGTLTVDTGTNLDTAITGVTTGDTFTTLYANIGNQTVTITANTGVTLFGTAAVPTLKNAVLTFTRTGSATWKCYITLSA